MAQHILVHLVDDLDGNTGDDVTTVTFGFDGVTYEIDFSEANANNLRDGLTAFIDAARRTGGRVQRDKTTTAQRPGGHGRSREQAHAIREWARVSGPDVADRSHSRYGSHGGRRLRRPTEAKDRTLAIPASIHRTP